MRGKGFALVAVAGLAAVATAAARVDAQQHIALPAVNLGASSFMDAVGGPGLLVRQAVEVYEARRFVGSNGADTPGSNSVRLRPDRLMTRSFRALPSLRLPPPARSGTARPGRGRLHLEVPPRPRATRLCPEIGKERFRIFDAVDLYAALKDVTDMKPVVVNPLVTFEQLVREILEAKEEEHRRESLDELLAKLQRKRRALTGEAETRFETAAGMDVKDLLDFLKGSSVGAAADYLTKHSALAPFLDKTVGTAAYRTVVSEKLDELREVTHGYGPDGRGRPGDYLEAFRAFVATNVNKLPALLVVTQRPRDLTREDLRKLKLALDLEGFSEKSVQTAWRQQKNEDVAATIVGYIRQLALGSPLVPYGERVDHAVQRLRKTHKFTDPQSKWLDRIARQVKLETVVDRASLDDGQFKTEGGFARLNKVFDGKLDTLLGELAEEVWKDAG